MGASARKPAEQLRGVFERCGYVRTKSQALYEERGHREYKKGSEVRLVLTDAEEARRVQALIRAAGLLPGKPFRKHARVVQPIYGAEAVEWFLQGGDRRVLDTGFGRDGHRRVRRPRSRRQAAI